MFEQRTDKRLELFFEIICIYNPIIKSIINYISKLLGINRYTNHISLIVAILIILIFIKPLSRVIKLRSIFLYFLIIFLYYISYILHPSNRLYFHDEWFLFVFQVCPYMFAGIILNKIEIRTDRIIHLARIAIVFLFVLLLRYNRMVSSVDEQMSRAYMALPIVMMITYGYFINRERIDFWFIILGVSFLMLCAVRGPLLLYMVFTGIMAVLYRKKKLIVLLVLSAIVIGVRGIREALVLELINYFYSKGYSTRVLEYLLRNDISNDNGRDEIYEAVKHWIRQNPKGTGLYSDRRASLGAAWVLRQTKGYGGYAHNIFYEVLCQYGVIIGSLLLVLLIFIFIYSIKHVASNKQIFLLILITCYFGKLFFSSSYLRERGFFALVAFCSSILFSKCKIRIVRAG